MKGQPPPIRDAARDPAAITDAAAAIRGGALVAFSTETVYGLGGDATNGAAVAKIFAAKSRPAHNPLICHFADTAPALAGEHAAATPLAHALADAFWPGPLTLVLERMPDSTIAPAVSANGGSIALRVPRLPLAREFIAACATPLAAPSANPSARLSPTLAMHVAGYLGMGGNADLAMILDCGACDAGIESTVIDARGDRPIILRPGSITGDMIADTCGIAPATIMHGGGGSAGNNAPEQSPLSPGQLPAHYAPRTPLVMNAPAPPSAGCIWIGFGAEDEKSPPRPCRAAFNLSPKGDLAEAAASLYAMLHRADALEAELIAVAPIPQEGPGIAINDRLTRAAHAHKNKDNETE